MKSPHSMIYPIVNRNFGNTPQNQNVPNKRQQTHKNTSKQLKNTSKKYQPRYYKITRTLSITYLKEDFIGHGIKKLRDNC